MDDLGRTVGGGISGLVGGAIAAIAAALRGLVAEAERVLPNGLLWAAIFVVLVAGAWILARR